jgi:hypothetical protein
MVTREEALEIASAYEAKHRPFDCVGIERVLSLDEVNSARLNPYYSGPPLRECWIAYAERGRLMIQSSDVILTSKATGKVVYAGSANDEG